MEITSEGRLVLASSSPRRIEMLRLLGLDFEVLPSGIEETVVQGEPPERHVLRLSAEKAGEIARAYPKAWVVGADTIVVIDGNILGKPSSEREARLMLERLSGRFHKVYTGFSIVKRCAGILLSDWAVSDVLFKDIPEEEITWYIRTDEPYDKAGGYAVQGRGAFFIREIHGSYTNVIGLPLCELVSKLKGAGAIRFPGQG